MWKHGHAAGTCCFLIDIQSGRWNDSPFLEKYQLIKKRSIHDCLASKRLMRLSLHQAARHAYPSNQTQQALQQQLPRVWLCGELFQAHHIRGWTAPDQRNTICEFFISAPLPFIAKVSYSIWRFFFFLLKLREQLQCTHTNKQSTAAAPWKWWKTWQSRKQVQGEV